MPPRHHRADWLFLLIAAALGGGLFFTSLGKLWPLVPGDLHVPPVRLHAQAVRLLAREGVDVRGWDWTTELSIAEDTIDYVERTFGSVQTRALLADGAGAVRYDVAFARYGDPHTTTISLRPEGGLVGWRTDLQEDDAGGKTSEAAALAAATAALGRVVGTATLPKWTQTGASARTLPHRIDHLFTFERVWGTSPDLRQRSQVRVAGTRVVSVSNSVVVPASARRDERRRAAPREALNAVGEILFGIAVLGAFTVFVQRLRDGTIRLAHAVVWSASVFALSLAASLLRPTGAFLAWDPLQPRAVGLLRYVVSLIQENIWTFAVLVAVVAAGDALDQDSGAQRGAALWKLTKGKIFDRAVGESSARGFLIGCVCGGVLCGSVLLLVRFAGAQVGLQPRGFFLFALNSPFPSLATLLYFLQVALLEELGYRYFAGAWLLAKTRRRFLAVFLPALVYGLTHTSLSFLPPDSPFWARAVVMTLVGCVWGWAFLRYDALTVVVLHLTSDLFIFNWPRLASGDSVIIATTVLTIAVPLLPALGLLWRRKRPVAAPLPADLNAEL